MFSLNQFTILALAVLVSFAALVSCQGLDPNLGFNFGLGGSDDNSDGCSCQDDSYSGSGGASSETSGDMSYSGSTNAGFNFNADVGGLVSGVLGGFLGGN